MTADFHFLILKFHHHHQHLKACRAGHRETITKYFSFRVLSKRFLFHFRNWMVFFVTFNLVVKIAWCGTTGLRETLSNNDQISDFTIRFCVFSLICNKKPNFEFSSIFFLDQDNHLVMLAHVLVHFFLLKLIIMSLQKCFHR